MKLRLPTRRDVTDRTLEQRAAPAHLSVVELQLAERYMATTQFSTTVRGLVIGECPGPSKSPELALFPYPAASSGGRLLTLGDLTAGEYLGSALRRNLCDEPAAFDESDAAERAREILGALFDESSELRVLLLGLKVAQAFELPHEFFRSWLFESRQRVVVIPHPSGLNRLYNDSETRQRARSWIRWAIAGEERPRRVKTE